MRSVRLELPTLAGGMSGLVSAGFSRPEQAGSGLAGWLGKYGKLTRVQPERCN